MENSGRRMYDQPVRTYAGSSVLSCRTIKRLKASVSQVLDYGIEVEDTVTASLEFENGAHGLFYATNANFKNESVQLAVDMERASFRMRDNILYQVAEDGTETVIVEDRRMPGSKFYYGASHEKLIRKFYNAWKPERRLYPCSRCGDEYSSDRCNSEFRSFRNLDRGIRDQ